MEDKLNNFVEFLAQSPVVRKINVLGGMEGVYEEEPLSEFDADEEHISLVGVDEPTLN